MAWIEDTHPASQVRPVRELATRHKGVIAEATMLSDWDASGRAGFTPKR